MDARYAYRYALLRAEIKRQLGASRNWSALPGLLDELHSVRLQHLADALIGRQLNAEGVRHQGQARRPDRMGGDCLRGWRAAPSARQRS